MSSQSIKQCQEAKEAISNVELENRIIENQGDLENKAPKEVLENNNKQNSNNLEERRFIDDEFSYLKEESLLGLNPSYYKNTFFGENYINEKNIEDENSVNDDKSTNNNSSNTPILSIKDVEWIRLSTLLREWNKTKLTDDESTKPFINFKIKNTMMPEHIEQKDDYTECNENESSENNKENINSNHINYNTREKLLKEALFQNLIFFNYANGDFYSKKVIRSDNPITPNHYIVSELLASKFPSFILNLFQIDNCDLEKGYYELKFFIDNNWKTIVIDDYIPCFRNTVKPVFYNPSSDNEIWMCLVEKAWAKINNGYINIMTSQVKLKSPFYNHYASDFQEKNSELINLSECFLAFTGISNRIISKESLINRDDDNNNKNHVGELLNNSNSLFYYSFLSVESDVICNGKSRIKIIDTHHHYNHYYNSSNDCENTNSSAHNIMRSSGKNVNSNDYNDICYECNIQKELVVDIPLKITATYSDELTDNNDNFANTNINLVYKEDVELNVEFLAYNSNRNTINSIIKEKFYEEEIVYDRKFKSLNKKDNGYLVESLLITQKSNEFNNDFGDIEYLLEVNLNWKGKQTYILNKENKNIKVVENKDESNITYTDNNNNNDTISNNSDNKSILDLKSIFPLRIKEPSIYRYDFIFDDVLKLLKKINKNSKDESSIYNKKDFFINRSNFMLVKLNSSTQNIEMTKLNKECSICSLEYMENLDNLSTISLTLFLEPGNYFLLTNFQILNDYLYSVVVYSNNLIQDYKNAYCFPEILNQLDKYNIYPYFNCFCDDTDSELNSLISVFFRKLLEYKNIYYVNSLLNNCFESSTKKNNSNDEVFKAKNINNIINDRFYKEKSKYSNHDNNNNNNNNNNTEITINLKQLDNFSSINNELFILNNDIFILVSHGIDSSNNNSIMIINAGSSSDYELEFDFKDYISCLRKSDSENNNLLYDFNARLKHSFNLNEDFNYNENPEYQNLKITIKPLETKLIIYSNINDYYYINSNFILKCTNNNISSNENKNKNSNNDILNNSKETSNKNLYFTKQIRINISKILYNKYNTEYCNFSLLLKNKISSKNKSYVVISNNNNNSKCITKENNNTTQSSLILPIETLIQGNRQTANLYNFEENSYKIKVLNHTTLIDDILDTCNNKRDIFRNKFNKIAKKTKHVREENFNKSNYLLNSYKPENLRVNSYNFNESKNNSNSKALYVNTICDNESINSGRSGKNKLFYSNNKIDNSLNNSFNNNNLMRMPFGIQMFKSNNFNRISGNSNFDANNGYISSRIESKLRSVDTSLKNTQISNNIGIGYISQRYANDNDINTYNNNLTNMNNHQYNPLNTEEYANSIVQTEYLNTNESINAFNNSNYYSKNPFNLNLNSSINFNNHNGNDFNNTMNAISNNNSNALFNNNKSNFFNTVTNISKLLVNNNNKLNNKARKLLLEDVEWNIIKYENGIYLGELNDLGERDGIGGYFFDSGESFIGSWKNDNREGYGIGYFETGIVLYEGEFKNDLRNGIGCLNLGNNDYYEGEFVDDFFDGQGIYFWDNGSCWVGRFSEGKQEGRGVCITHKGDNIVKEFKNGKVKRRKYSDSEEEIEEEMMRDFENEEYEKERNSTKLLFHKKNINNIYEKYNKKYIHTGNLSNVHKNKNIMKNIRYKKLQEKINDPEVKENYYRDKVRKNFGSLFDN